ncbi:putative MFS family arabinose efflux permease [Geodermatophilus normandii]|uniref:Putative MFS family arabinose efflux permease n=1 Tax=Geodermatophilus normandii TaxID=1137989 RepID=A0A317QRN1_9ACTN|nr:MFS transporter [Geodermatophilus normandii]PWW24815.1 putative MFS family arabinose efflux permease [Geodermatophilus normandii]
MTSLSKPADAPGVIRSLVPARIDRLPWSPFHTRMVAALGTAWILDGLEITVAGAVVDRLTEPETLGLSGTEVGLIATVYLLGEVVGALFFGRLSDKLGRRKLFMVTLAVYLVGSGLTALTLGNGPGWVAFLYLTRFIAGMGIGGEYAAIHSAIDELIPARYRGRVDIMVSGTYWGGAVLGTLGTFVLLNAVEPSVGWRIAFLIGPVLGLVILLVRRHLPESPRWQVMHGREHEAEGTIAHIEHEVEHGGRTLEPVDESRAIELKPTPDIGYAALTRVLFSEYPARAVYGATLMVTQSFLYNAIFFTYVLVLGTYYGVDSGDAPLFLIAFAVGNLAGPFVLGHLFDTVGRRKMIAGTYVLSGVLLAVTAFLFQAGALTAVTQTIAWSVIFFFASAGASSAYLTVSEIFPMEVRAKAIAVFFAIAQCFGALGPVVYGSLIGDGSEPIRLFWGYLLGAGVMVLGGIVAAVLGIDAEGRSLEDVATPLSARRPGARAEGAARPRL